MDVTESMQKFWEKNDSARVQRRNYQGLTTTKICRKSIDYENMKAEYARVKKEIEEEISYGDDNKADLGGNMVSTCACPGCHRKKNHKTAASKECTWYNKLTGIKHKYVLHSLEQLAHKISPASVFDMAEALLMKLHEKGAVTMDMATDLFQSDLSWMKIDGIQDLQNEGTVSDAL
eukprot:8591889-Ditylum_brightwellii.AAC.1